ncbi:succinate dehydrogenase cytochrome b subunit [Psychroflexus lacisalsi]|nr:succinate dehydrogenase cytochrome b subunit [Psychroflexus lacisalsi]MBZ9620601.1 succinate dehydrogenase cytochrome b subunit [Psychroflexus lacisalsi]
MKNAITRKNLMALTGLFLCFFLIIHLLGNLQLLMPPNEARLQYNLYSDFLSNNILVKLISYVLYASILVHTIDSIYLSIKAKKASGSSYVVDKRNRASKWYSRQMMLLGTLIFAFLVIHFKDFWFIYKFGTLPMDSAGNKDLYGLVVASFQDLWYVILYAISILVLGFHLLHGFFSAFRTIGLYNPKYNRIVKLIGVIFAVSMTIGYFVIPFYIYLNV